MRQFEPAGKKIFIACCLSSPCKTKPYSSSSSMTPQPMPAPGWIDLLGFAIPFSSLHANRMDWESTALSPFQLQNISCKKHICMIFQDIFLGKGVLFQYLSKPVPRRGAAKVFCLFFFLRPARPGALPIFTHEKEE